MIAPRLFVVLENASGEVLHVTSRYSSANSILQSLPEGIRGCFGVVRYDPNENWMPTTENEKEAVTCI